jgi:hypothetical protein
MIRRLAAILGIGLLLALLMSLVWAVHLHRINSSSGTATDATVVTIR